MYKTPNIAPYPSAGVGMEDSTFLQRLRPNEEILAELGQVEASIAEKLAKARS